VLLAANLVAASRFHLDYDVIAPGSATGLHDTIAVAAKDSAQPVPTYSPSPQSGFLYTTVSISERVNGFVALWAKVDHDVSLIEEERITNNQPPKVVQRLNQADMDESKLFAEIVALRTLGYPVGIHGDGAAILGVIDANVVDGKFERGDVITAVDGKPVALRDDVGTIMAGHKAGDRVRLTLRNGSTARDVVVLTHGAPRTNRALIGVQITTSNARFDFPFDIKIDTGGVGGPSAGLAFTLGLLDVLTPGELTGGHKVAVTGTIDIDGTVGQIGGVEQKAIAARRAGAVAFIVPAGEERDARKHAGKMAVLPVHDLADALAALRGIGGGVLPGH